ncbi:MAG: DNA topoisomerase I [Acidobacteria bacterium RIFCSPLOWO2_12_FULL_65_11]|nr:MAG: DNA topoisomerase I [Acidobacteria bacterium RIFCSPLOWO2_02_FULL_64_15]OFW32876.1 MAG: DNA topoisomerase I [Acidobacteria bacterium RIFCSPLOWO2_12_FULL_65_11]
MAKALVVVESPAKAKTINKYLGRDYKVIASMGHIRDLPKSKLGVDIDHDFAEEYESIASRKKIIKELKAAAKDASDIYVATDPDREGEAIGWHLKHELGGKRRKIHRLTFNEITKKAVQYALEHPRAIDEKMVEAQRARRVLDRLVGYKISPILWDKVRRGLSAGRVQSVALKLVRDRERAIEEFVAEEYWHLFARLACNQPPEFDAKLVKSHGENIKIGNEEQAKAVVAALERASWVVSSVTTKERKRHAAPPFITSKLQQTARFPVKKTMMLAQQLYEGVELPGLGVDGPIGLITYMRTDSVRVGDDALVAVREHIKAAFGDEYLPEKANAYKSKADAQDAHEAIRPTSMQYDPETVRPYLTQDQYSLYRLIWNRFVASQMPPATFDETTVDITANPSTGSGQGDYLFRVKGTVPKFAGWMATYGLTPGEPEQKEQASGPGEDVRAPESTVEREAEEEESAVSGVLPPLAEGDRLELKALRPDQKFTQPPPRFSEATLVKELEENGIGRPSTYASIISVLQDRDYVVKLEGRFKPTSLGVIISDLLVKSFDDIIDVEYTRSLEEDLDKIEQGKTNYVKTLAGFYKKFKKDLARAGKEMQNLKEGIKTDEICDRCGLPMLIKVGRFGPFVACSGYPDCTNTREIEKQEPESETGEEEIEPCENCGKPMVVKRGRFGQFLACSGYPECKTTRKLIATKLGGLRAAKADQILDEKCPRCGSNLVLKQGRFGEFTACTKYPECRYIKHKTTGVRCPKDADRGGEVVERKSRRGKMFFGCSNYPDCDFVLWNRPVNEKCPKCSTPFLVEKTTKKHGRQLLCGNEDCDYARSEELVETTA